MQEQIKHLRDELINDERFNIDDFIELLEFEKSNGKTLIRITVNKFQDYESNLSITFE